MSQLVAARTEDISATLLPCLSVGAWSAKCPHRFCGQKYGVLGSRTANWWPWVAVHEFLLLPALCQLFKGVQGDSRSYKSLVALSGSCADWCVQRWLSAHSASGSWRPSLRQVLVVISLLFLCTGRLSLHWRQAFRSAVTQLTGLCMPLGIGSRSIISRRHVSVFEHAWPMHEIRGPHLCPMHWRMLLFDFLSPAYATPTGNPNCPDPNKRRDVAGTATSRP